MLSMPRSPREIAATVARAASRLWINNRLPEVAIEELLRPEPKGAPNFTCGVKSDAVLSLPSTISSGAGSRL